MPPVFFIYFLFLCPWYCLPYGFAAEVVVGVLHIWLKWINASKCCFNLKNDYCFNFIGIKRGQKRKSMRILKKNMNIIRKNANFGNFAFWNHWIDATVGRPGNPESIQQSRCQTCLTWNLPNYVLQKFIAFVKMLKH